MKTKHYLIFTLIAFVMLTLVANSFAQDTQTEYIVQVIYFIPNDSKTDPDIDTQLETLIKDVQRFYADEMDRHGFGRKTFKFEVAANGNAVVHHVNGKFNDPHYHDPRKVISEIGEHFDILKNIYLVAVDSNQAEYCGVAHGRFAFLRAPGQCVRPWVAAHELGHTFGLWHDRRDLSYIMNDFQNGYLSGDENVLKSIRIYNQLPKCAAEWLNVHRYFNPNQSAFGEPTTIQMLPPSLVDSPATIRLEFEMTDPDGLHLAQLITQTRKEYPDNFLDCKKLQGENSVVEFVTSEIISDPTDFRLEVIDVEGNITSSEFLVDLASLLPPSKAVSIPDVKLAAAIQKTLGLTAGQAITQLDMLRLTRLAASDQQITDLTGLSHATNLKDLFLINNRIKDILPLASLKQLRVLWLLRCKQIGDISPLSGLTQLQELHLQLNQIRDISPLAGLTRLQALWCGVNSIRDISPLANLKQLEELSLWDNRINNISALGRLTRLRSLSLSNNQISDVSSLIGFTNLVELDLVGNPIKNRKPLFELLKKNPNVKIYLKNHREPLPVNLSNFRAEHTKAGVVLKWTTESEIDNAGFYIYRSETKEGEFKVLNLTMIQGAGTTSERNEYAWTDTTAKPNTVYYYRIEDVSHAGVHKQLATVRLRGLVSASGKLATNWAVLKTQK